MDFNNLLILFDRGQAVVAVETPITERKPYILPYLQRTTIGIVHKIHIEVSGTNLGGCT